MVPDVGPSIPNEVKFSNLVQPSDLDVGEREIEATNFRSIT